MLRKKIPVICAAIVFGALMYNYYRLFTNVTFARSQKLTNQMKFFANPFTKKSLLQNLTESLEKYLREASSTPKHNVSFASCRERGIINYDDTCTNRTRPCLRKIIPHNPRERLESLLRLKMSIPQKYLEVLQKMRDQVKTTQEVIIVTALNTDYYDVSQDMQRNLHREVFPHLRNFTFIVYDLGLNPEQLLMVKKHCRCTVITFPFLELPEFLQDLNCYAWKVFIIAAHIEQAEVIIWGDSSVRITNGSAIPDLVERTKIRGIQQSCGWEPASPYRTLPGLYEAFGDSPCAYLSFRECWAGFGAYHREPLISHAFIRPWLACAVTQRCMCPVPYFEVAHCNQHDLTTIGDCHRFDQSALTTILAKLYREYFDHFAVDDGHFRSTERFSFYEYYKEIEKERH